MRLEDYLEFLAPLDIRIKGHRIGIDDVLRYYLNGYNADEIVATFPTLNLEKIHAVITYYWHNQAKVDAYLSDLAKWREARYQEWLANPSPAIQRLRKLKSQSVLIKQEAA